MQPLWLSRDKNWEPAIWTLKKHREGKDQNHHKAKVSEKGITRI